jgi:GxxExxY protein
MADYSHAALTHVIIGAFFKVYNELGHGYSEKIYRRALAIVLRELGLEAIEERRIKVIFHGALIGTFWVDLVVDGKIVVEIKAARQLEARDEAQILNYLKCAGGGVGLLVNFGRPLTYKRFVMGDPDANLPNLADLSDEPDPLDADAAI